MSVWSDDGKGSDLSMYRRMAVSGARPADQHYGGDSMGVKNPSVCKPRDEVLRGDLSDAIFAADFGDLIAGSAPKVYQDAKAFFRNTHPAQQLCKVVQAVF